jgi:6-phospho-3-hexuloisomerase
MDYRALVAAVLEENRQVLEAVNSQQLERFLEEILRARTLHLYGMGRMQLSVRAFAMRLKHMGFDTYVVYDTTSPRIGAGDLLIGHCAVTNVELNVIRLAKAAGARVALLTAHPENEHGRLADLCVRVPGQIFGDPQEVKVDPADGFVARASPLPVHGYCRDAAYREKRSIAAVDAGKSYEPGGPSPFIRLTSLKPDHDDISQFALIIRAGGIKPKLRPRNSRMPQHRVRPVVPRVSVKKRARNAGLA